MIFDWMLFNVALVTIYTRIIVVFVAPVNLLCSSTSAPSGGSHAGDAYLEFDGTSGFSSFPDLWNISIVCYIALLRNFVIFDWMWLSRYVPEL